MSSMQLLCVPIPFCVFFLDHTGITRQESLTGNTAPKIRPRARDATPFCFAVNENRYNTVKKKKVDTRTLDNAITCVGAAAGRARDVSQLSGPILLRVFAFVFVRWPARCMRAACRHGFVPP